MAQVIDGKYEVLRKIADGGMSSVYLVRDLHLGKRWAMKVLRERDGNQSDPQLIKYLMGEAWRMKELSHPALPLVVDVLMIRDRIHIIMEYVSGQTLEQILLKQGCLPQKEVVRIGIELCRVLIYLHTRKPAMIYRDMKPSNVIITPEGDVKLIDFGIMREYKKNGREDTISLGTMGYAAPEQFGGMGQTDPRTDVYGLGMTLYHMVTGHNPAKPPYEIRPIRQWKPGLSVGLEMIISRCIAKNPKDRYLDCRQLCNQLSQYEKLGMRMDRRNWCKLILFSLLMLLSAGCLVGGFVLDRHNQERVMAQYTHMLERGEYEQAIELKPGRIEAYIYQVKRFRESEGGINRQEIEDMESLIYRHQDELVSEDAYSDLCFELGISIWYWMEGDKEDSIIRASAWFELADTYVNDRCEYNPQVLLIYRGIGYFYREINPHVEKGNYRKSEFKAFWKTLCQMQDVFRKQEDMAELLRCEAYCMMVLSIKNYMGQFRVAGIEKLEMRQQCQRIYTQLKEGDFSLIDGRIWVKYQDTLNLEYIEELVEDIDAVD